MPRRHLLRLLVGAIVLSLVLYAFKSRGPEISLSFDGGPLSHAEDDSCRPSDDCNKPHLQEPVEPPLTHTSLPIEVPAQELLPHKDSTAASTAQEKPSSTYKAFPTYPPLPAEPATSQRALPSTNLTRAVVIAKTLSEDLSWFYSSEYVPDSLNISKLHYTIDDIHQNQPSSVPANRGHEGMGYLTYVINHYHALPDVSIFMHAHRVTWHNNDFLNSDAAAMITRLNPEYVMRHGYVNLRCHNDPGCPAHLRPTASLPFDENKPEQSFVGRAFRQIFPGHELPEALSQPCCAQFAVSRETILKIPIERYQELRQWLIDSELADTITGRIFEYLWQYIFAGEAELCRDEVMCYCDGYGVCFEEYMSDGEVIDAREQIRIYALMRLEIRDNLKELKRLSDDDMGVDGSEQEMRSRRRRVEELERRNKWVAEEVRVRHRRALALGNDPKARSRAVAKSGVTSSET